MNKRVRNLGLLLAGVGLSYFGASGGAQDQAGGAAGAQPAEAAVFEKEIRPLLERYCITCHSTEKQKGDLDLEPFVSLDAVKRDTKVWQKVIEQMADNEMPPEDEPQPSPAEKERLTTWARTTLDDVTRSQAGDPGPVVLRRLSNAEYTYTVRDLTGVASLDPAREFPVDGAAGEGFTNTGQSLVMSPSLITKYLDAGKGIAAHAVLLPDGLRFSPGTTKRDWTEEILAEIRGFYREFTDPSGGGGQVNLQGIVFDTNEGGRLPLERYLAAALEEREALTNGSKTAEAAARERGLSPKYLATVLTLLGDDRPSPLLDGLRARWRTAKPGDVPALTAEVAPWQAALWKFSSVGHVGKVGGPKGWMEPVNPIASQHEVRIKIPEAAAADGGEVTLYLVTADAGDGNEHDFAVWQQPRLVRAGRPDLLLRDVRAVSRALAARRERLFANSAKCLAAAAEASAGPATVDTGELARRHGVEADDLRLWLAYLGIGTGDAVKIDSLFTNKINGSATYDFIKGWGAGETPLLLANSSDNHVRVPGNMKPHGVAVHPSPALRVAVGWRSPVAGTFRADANVTHAHPECGNGVAWSLELRRGATRRRLATGSAQGSEGVKIGPIDDLVVQAGDLISLIVGPRDGNHSCDLTAVDLTLTKAGEDGQKWDLAADVSPDVLAGNPHADRFGNADVWHFYTEPEGGAGGLAAVIPAGSLLAKWQAAATAAEKQTLAQAVQTLLTSKPPETKDAPDAILYRELVSPGGPLLGTAQQPAGAPAAADPAAPATGVGPDPAIFGHHPDGRPADPASLCVRAPSVIEIRLPADLVAGCEFVATGTLDASAAAEGSVQFVARTTRPDSAQGLLPTTAKVVTAGGTWTANNRDVAHDTPVVVADGSAARKRVEAAFEEFRQSFPPALCYAKIVPVDEVVTLTLFHREDEHLARLMLDDAQRARLDRMWEQLHYVSDDALQLVDALEQIIQYATQDADPKVFEPLQQPFADRAAAHRQRLVETEPKHLEAVLAFAARAYRRPLTDAERDELRKLYAKLREQELPHDEAVRLTIARVLVSPAFLYRAEEPKPGTAPAPVNDYELASRLSYFLWSSTPDAELLDLAAAGKLRDPETVVAQTKRMLGDERVRRLATEFGCQWLHVHGFDALDEKSDRHFPTFGGLRDDMYEESIRFFADLFQRDATVLSILDADHAFLNESLAKHYGIPDVTGEAWRRVDGVRKFSRGGILAQGATLAKQSGASRTSPILRGNWVAEVLLGDRLPRPPKDVPVLPEDEATESLTVRELTERHSADPRCAGCHVRIDAFGFALEGFDAIGRRRDRDLGDRALDVRATVMDGTEIEGIDGLRDYLLTKRRDEFVRQFCRKLLGYALGRGVQLSDEPLLGEMKAKLEAGGYRVGVAVEAIVRSRQFLDVRGRDHAGAGDEQHHNGSEEPNR